MAVAGAVAAPVLLLLRSRFAAPAALVSVVAQLGLDLLTFGFHDRYAQLGPRLAALDLVVIALSVGLVVYSRRSARAGVLR